MGLSNCFRKIQVDYLAQNEHNSFSKLGQNDATLGHIIFIIDIVMSLIGRNWENNMKNRPNLERESFFWKVQWNLDFIE